MSGRNRPPLPRHGRLLGKVAMIHHPRQFRHALERDLPPLTAHVRRAQRLDEIAGLLLQALMRLGQGFQVLIQPAIGGLTRLFQETHLFIVALERVMERAHEPIDRLLTLGEIPFGFGLQGFK